MDPSLAAVVIASIGAIVVALVRFVPNKGGNGAMILESRVAVLEAQLLNVGQTMRDIKDDLAAIRQLIADLSANRELP